MSGVVLLSRGSAKAYQLHVPGRSYVNFVPQGCRPVTERDKLFGHCHPVIAGWDCSCPTTSHPASNQTRFYKGLASVGCVGGDAAAGPSGVALYKRAVRYLLSGVQVVKGALAGAGFEYPPRVRTT